VRRLASTSPSCPSQEYPRAFFRRPGIPIRSDHGLSVPMQLARPGGGYVLSSPGSPFLVADGRPKRCSEPFVGNALDDCRVVDHHAWGLVGLIACALPLRPQRPSWAPPLSATAAIAIQSPIPPAASEQPPDAPAVWLYVPVCGQCLRLRYPISSKNFRPRMLLTLSIVQQSQATRHREGLSPPPPPGHCADDKQNAGFAM